MTKIDVPQGFRRFVWFFDPDLREDYGSIGKALPDAIDSLPDHEREELKTFLEFLLENDLADETLKACWDYAGPVWNFQLGGHRHFYKRALELLAEKYPDTP